MKKVTVTGKTVEEAVDKALLELNTNRDQVNIRVLEEPNKGFLGLIGSKDAVVEVEKKIDPVQEAKKFLLSVFDAMNVELHIDIEQKADTSSLISWAKNSGSSSGGTGIPSILFNT